MIHRNLRRLTVIGTLKIAAIRSLAGPLYSWVHGLACIVETVVAKLVVSSAVCSVGSALKSYSCDPHTSKQTNKQTNKQTRRDVTVLRRGLRRSAGCAALGYGMPLTAMDAALRTQSRAFYLHSGRCVRICGRAVARALTTAARLRAHCLDAHVHVFVSDGATPQYVTAVHNTCQGVTERRPRAA